MSAILAALKGLPLERAAAGIVALTGVRPGEAGGLRWEEWDRAKDHVKPAVWHKIVGTTKTEQSERYVAVTDELRDILLDLWNARQCPIAGYILSGASQGPASESRQYGQAVNPGRVECLRDLQTAGVREARRA